MQEEGTDERVSLGTHWPGRLSPTSLTFMSEIVVGGWRTAVGDLPLTLSSGRERTGDRERLSFKRTQTGVTLVFDRLSSLSTPIDLDSLLLGHWKDSNPCTPPAPAQRGKSPSQTLPFPCSRNPSRQVLHREIERSYWTFNDLITLSVSQQSHNAKRLTTRRSDRRSKPSTSVCST